MEYPLPAMIPSTSSCRLPTTITSHCQFWLKKCCWKVAMQSVGSNNWAIAPLPMQTTFVSWTWMVAQCRDLSGGSNCSLWLWKLSVLDCKGMILCHIQLVLLESHRVCSSGLKTSQWIGQGRKFWVCVVTSGIFLHERLMLACRIPCVPVGYTQLDHFLPFVVWRDWFVVMPAPCQ